VRQHEEYLTIARFSHIDAPFYIENFQKQSKI